MTSSTTGVTIKWCSTTKVCDTCVGLGQQQALQACAKCFEKLSANFLHPGTNLYCVTLQPIKCAHSHKPRRCLTSGHVCFACILTTIIQMFFNRPRAAPTAARPLPSVTAPCLSAQLVSLLSRISTSFSPAAVRMATYSHAQMPSQLTIHLDQDPLHQLDPTHPSSSYFCHSQRLAAHKLHRSQTTVQHLTDGPHMCHPRLLLCGEKGNGQQHLSTALLDAMEETSVFMLSIAKLYGDQRAHSPDDLLVSLFSDACR